MQLVNRGRLSVQPVTDEALEAVVELGDTGGWEDLVVKTKPVKEGASKKKAKKAKVPTEETQEEKPIKRKTKAVKQVPQDGKPTKGRRAAVKIEAQVEKPTKAKRKRGQIAADEGEPAPATGGESGGLPENGVERRVTRRRNP